MLCKLPYKSSLLLIMMVLSSCKLTDVGGSVQGSLEKETTFPAASDTTPDFEKEVGGNAAPMTQDDAYDVLEDTALHVDVANGVLANDTDPNGDAIFVINNTTPNHGDVVVDRYGSMHYTPNAGYSGLDSFQYTISDGELETSANVQLTITDAPNRAPVAQGDTYSVVENATLSRNAANGVLKNDTDPDGDSISVTNNTNPSHGSVSINSNGSFTYTPSNNYAGADSFTYTISDGMLTDTATVNINVTNAPNQAPNAVNKSYATNENTAFSRSANNGLLSGATDPDGDMLSVSSNTNPSHGSVAVNSNGSFTYTPSFGYHGNDSFTYTITDGALNDTATVSITINEAPNQAPVASNKSYSTDENTTLNVSSGNGLLQGAMDPDGDPITASKVTNPSHGSVSINANGSFTYVPSNGYHGSDSFNFRVSDGALSVTRTASITIVEAPNQAPNAVNKSYSLNQDSTLSINSNSGLLSGATDPEDDTLSVSGNSNPSHGSVSINSNGSFTYTPNAGYYGNDSFSFTITDGMLTDSATVSLTINQSSSIPTTSGCSTSAPTLAGSLGGKSTSARKTVSLCANVQASPARITLHWANVSGVGRNSISVYRRVDGTTSWGNAIGYPSAGGNTYQDNNVTVGVHYNYKVQMSTSAGTAYGYINSGIAVNPVDYQGKVIVVVDNTFESSLSSYIDTLIEDYYATGWIPIVRYVNRSDTAQSVRTVIKSEYDNDPSDVKAVFLLGHVPVPYSGTMNPDGHSDHLAAWAADGYYGDMNNSWPLGGAATWNETHGANTDSKFDPSDYPSTVELAVGRVDMYGLPAFSQSELQLLQDYLNRLHNFKNGTFVPQTRALIKDNLLWAGSNFARSAYTTFSAAVDPSTITADYYGGSYFSATDNNSYLWGYAGGGGSRVSIDGHGTTSDLASKNMSAVFNMAYGSYFGDWDAQDNVLRSFLADSEGLTSVYSGKRQFYAHQMAMGKTVGHAIRESMNNSDSNFNPSNGVSFGAGSVYMGLLGEPTLKMVYMKSPTNLNVTNNNGNFRFTWTAAPGAAADSVDGYNIYKVNGSSMTKVNSTLLSATATSYNSNMGVSNNTRFVIRPVKLQTTASGTYWDIGLGSEDTY